MTQLVWLDPDNPYQPFPPVSTALTDPEGLLAAGGSLHPERLLNAYQHGIFPWYEEGQPILWWSPNPRAVIYTNKLKISRSLKKTLRNKPFQVSRNQAFEQVIKACAAPRNYTDGTWIVDEMMEAYLSLHERGHAHSIEVWNKEGELVGGLYGVLIKGLFCGESMFSRERDMSKVALVYLSQWLEEQGIYTIDCQLPNPHLMSLGAETISREDFVKHCLQSK